MVKLPLELEHALLGFLWQQPMHAYEIHRTLTQAEALGLVWHLKQSQLYALLTRLEEAGYVESTTELQGTRPPRRLLHLTPSGRAAYEQWLTAPVAHGRDFRIEFLAKLFFAARQDTGTVSALIDAQRETCQTWLADLRDRALGVDAERPYDRLVLEFRIGQLEAILRWLDTCAATLTLGVGR